MEITGLISVQCYQWINAHIMLSNLQSHKNEEILDNLKL